MQAELVEALGRGVYAEEEVFGGHVRGEAGLCGRDLLAEGLY